MQAPLYWLCKWKEQELLVIFTLLTKERCFAGRHEFNDNDYVAAFFHKTEIIKLEILNEEKMFEEVTWTWSSR